MLAVVAVWLKKPTSSIMAEGLVGIAVDQLLKPGKEELLDCANVPMPAGSW